MSLHSLATRARNGRFGNERRTDYTELNFVLVVLVAAALTAYAIMRGEELIAVAATCVPLVIWLIARPTLVLVVLGASLPFVESVAGGAGGYNIALSDLLMLLICAGIVFERTVGISVPIVRALRPVALPVVQYSGFMIVLLSVHTLDFGHLAKTGQRFELFLIPLLIGAFAALKGKYLPLLKGYILACTVLAAVWPLDSLNLQHNPAGQMMANAILLFVGVRALRPLLPCVVVLVPGLILTESRGAIVAAVIGVVVILAMQGLRIRTMIARAVPLALIGVVTLAFVPSSTISRLTTFSASVNTSAGYSIYIRHQYTSQASQLIHQNPYTGVGIGDYLAADSQITPYPEQDPHEVLYLQAAEGGYGLAVSFVLLLGGTILALGRMRKVVEIAPAAAGILVATVAHGLVDVYWVRGTPVLSWILVGMACGCLFRQRQEAETLPP